jgi:hypothetical protein
MCSGFVNACSIGINLIISAELGLVSDNRRAQWAMLLICALMMVQAGTDPRFYAKREADTCERGRGMVRLQSIVRHRPAYTAIVILTVVSATPIAVIAVEKTMRSSFLWMGSAFVIDSMIMGTRIYLLRNHRSEYTQCVMPCCDECRGLREAGRTSS